MFRFNVQACHNSLLIAWNDYLFPGLYRVLDVAVFTLSPFIVLGHLAFRHCPGRLLAQTDVLIPAAPALQSGDSPFTGLEPDLVPPITVFAQAPSNGDFPIGFPWSDVGYATLLALIVGGVLFRIVPACLVFLKEQREDTGKLVAELKAQNLKAEANRQEFFEARIKELISHHETQMRLVTTSAQTSMADLHQDMKDLIAAVHSSHKTQDPK